jgi:hypothetical protein
MITRRKKLWVSRGYGLLLNVLQPKPFIIPMN